MIPISLLFWVNSIKDAVAIGHQVKLEGIGKGNIMFSRMNFYFRILWLLNG
jgi:hypothetical protein